MATVVQARRVAEPVAHAPFRCDRDRRPCQVPPATGPSATQWQLRPRPEDKGITGCRRIEESGNSFGIVPLSLSTTVVVRTSWTASRVQASCFHPTTALLLGHVGCRPAGSPAVRTRARCPGLTECPPALDCVSAHLRAPSDQDKVYSGRRVGATMAERSTSRPHRPPPAWAGGRESGFGRAKTGVGHERLTAATESNCRATVDLAGSASPLGWWGGGARRDLVVDRG